MPLMSGGLSDFQYNRNSEQAQAESRHVIRKTPFSVETVKEKELG